MNDASQHPMDHDVSSGFDLLAGPSTQVYKIACAVAKRKSPIWGVREEEVKIDS